MKYQLFINNKKNGKSRSSFDRIIQDLYIALSRHISIHRNCDDIEVQIKSMWLGSVAKTWVVNTELNVSLQSEDSFQNILLSSMYPEFRLIDTMSMMCVDGNTHAPSDDNDDNDDNGNDVRVESTEIRRDDVSFARGNFPRSSPDYQFNSREIVSYAPHASQTLRESYEQSLDKITLDDNDNDVYDFDAENNRDIQEFAADKKSYLMIASDVNKGSLNPNDINPFFQCKYIIFECMERLNKLNVDAIDYSNPSDAEILKNEYLTFLNFQQAYDAHEETDEELDDELRNMNCLPDDSDDDYSKYGVDF